MEINHNNRVFGFTLAWVTLVLHRLLSPQLQYWRARGSAWPISAACLLGLMLIDIAPFRHVTEG